MTITSLTSREFNQDPAKAKRAASQGPVIITDRSKPVLVLLSIDEYRRLAGGSKNMLEPHQCTSRSTARSVTV